jgi:integrase/recombinase XerD
MKELFSQFADTMKVRNLAQSTINSYKLFLFEFFKFIGNQDPLSVDYKDVEKYQLHLMDRGLSANTINGKISAVKMFYLKTLRRQWPNDIAPWIRKKRIVPTLFTLQEIASLINATTHIKSRTVFMTVYATGMRSCEVRRLKASDIDSSRMQIKVNGKGGKQRFVPLTPFLLESLRKYWVDYKQNKSEWLFPGGLDYWKLPYHGVSLRRAFQAAKLRAGIQKPGSLHILRHCYATHLLESGVDIRLIQLLLGHSVMRSTEIYTHLRSQFAQEIKNPLDAISDLLIKR